MSTTFALGTYDAEVVRRALFVACLLAAAACSPRRALKMDHDGGRAFLVVVDELGDPISLREFSSAAALEPFELEAGERMFGFTVRTTDFMPAGTTSPVDDAMLAGVEVRLATSPRGEAGACGRCLADVPVGPQPIYAGDSCPLTTSIPFEVFDDDGQAYAGSTPGRKDAELAATLRDRIRIDWPGVCACDVPERDASIPRPLSFELLAPTWSGGAYEAVAIDPADDTIGAFSSMFQTIVDGTDTSRVWTRTDGLGSTVLGVVPIAPTASVSRFLLGGLTLDADAAPTYAIARAEPGLPIDEVTPAGLEGFVPTTVRRFDGPIVMAGMQAGASAVAICDDETACAVREVDACEDAAVASDAVVTESGLVVARVSGRRLAIEGADGQSCIDLDDALDTPQGYPAHHVFNVQRMGTAADRVYVCARLRLENKGTYEDGGTFIFGAATTPDRLDGGFELLTVSVGEGDYCDEMLTVGDHLVLGIARRLLVEIDENGEIVHELDWKETLGQTALRMRAASSRQLAITMGRSSSNHTRYIGHGLGRAPRTGGRVAVLEGGPFPATAWFRHVDFDSGSDGSILALPNGGDRMPQRIVDGAIEDIEITDLYPQGGGLDVMVSGAHDDDTNTFVIAGTIRGRKLQNGDIEPNRPWWRRIDLAQGRFVSTINFVESTDASEMTQIVPGTIGYSDGSGRLHGIRNDTGRRIAVDYDDPRTSEVEQPPHRIDIDDPLDDEPDYFINEIVKGTGVSWALGSLGFLARIVPTLDDGGTALPLRASLETASGALAETPRNLLSGAALCPDILAVATSGGNFLVTPDGVSPLGEPSMRPDLDLRPRHLMRAGDRLITITEGKWILIDDHIVGRIPFDPLFAYTDGRQLVIASFADRISVAQLD